MLLPDEGQVAVLGGVAPLIEVTGGMVGELTARDNIWLAAGLHGLTKRQIEERFDEIVDFAEIGDFLDTPFRHFSSGMKVRLGFSVVTTLDEPIVLVDEVLAVGDRSFREKCHVRMQEMLSGGRTLFLVSHSEPDLLRYCTRGLYLKAGELITDGSVEDALGDYNVDSGRERGPSRTSGCPTPEPDAGVPDVDGWACSGTTTSRTVSTAGVVRSVLRQTLRNLEVVIVDDASTDGMAQVADRLAAQHPRVQAVHLPENSGGCSRPRNVGMEHARAPYVMFLDSDDIYERHACKNLLLEAERTGADMVAGQCVRIFLDRDREDGWFTELYTERATYAGVRENPGLFFDPLSTNKIYRRQFLEDGDIPFPEGVHYEDSLFSTKVYCQANLIAVIPNVVYYWNVVRDAEEKSITQRRFEFDNFRDRIAVHRMMDDYLVTHGGADLKPYKDFKFIRHDLRLYLNDLPARDVDYQRRFVKLAADYLATVSEQTLAMVDPVERICVHMLRRRDIEETLKTVHYLRHGFKVATELVERDGRIYWSAKYLDTAEDRTIMDVTDMGLHRLGFAEQVLFNEITKIDFRAGRLVLEGRLLNQFRRIAASDDVSTTVKGQ